MKTCKRCSNEKPEGEFLQSKKRDRSLSSECKDCRKTRLRANQTRYEQRHPEKVKTSRAKYAANIQARYRKRHPELVLNRYMKWMYGISLEEYHELSQQQNGVCAICGGLPRSRNRRLCIDHCHLTGKVRGLLCHKCNSTLGFMKDSPSLLQAAIDYLNRSSTS